MSVLEKILTFFYPKRCLLCGRAGAVNGDELCADCAKLQPDIRVRFFALHAGRRDYTLECRAPQRYREPFRSSLWRFKFKNETKLAKPLAKLMLPAIDKNRGLGLYCTGAHQPGEAETARVRSIGAACKRGIEVDGYSVPHEYFGEDEAQPHAAQFERQGT